jgi:sugar-phosphatase
VLTIGCPDADVGVLIAQTGSVELTVDAILFDLDGTLIDSTPSVDRCWARLAERLEISFESLNGSYHGIPSRQTVSRLMHGRPQPEIDEMVAWIDAEEVGDVEGIVVLPGAHDILAALPPHRWTIVTSGTNQLATTRIKAAGLPSPPRMITADDIVHGKPSPEPYLKGAALLGFAPERCLVVEDAPAGITAGVASGANVLGLRTTHHDLGVPMADDLSSVTIEEQGSALVVRF